MSSACVLRYRPLAILLVFFFLSGEGCRQKREILDRPQTVPVTGTVLYQGKPVENATVTFINDVAQKSAYAVTDKNGVFQLMTFEKGDGAIQGEQRVAVRRVNIVDKTPPGLDLAAGGVAPPPEITWIVPEKYSNAETSGLTAHVIESGKNDFTFDLR